MLYQFLSLIFLCLSLTFLSVPLLDNQRSSTVIINLWVSTNNAPQIIHSDHSPWSSTVIINEAPPWSSTVVRMGGVVEKHQATNGKRDERGRLKVKTVWVWVLSLWFHLGFFFFFFFFFFLVFGHVNCTCSLGFFFFTWFSTMNSNWLDQMQGRRWFWIGFFCGFMVVEVGVAVVVVGMGFCYGSSMGSWWWWWWQVVFRFCLGGSR